MITNDIIQLLEYSSVSLSYMLCVTKSGAATHGTPNDSSETGTRNIQCAGLQNHDIVTQVTNHPVGK